MRKNQDPQQPHKRTLPLSDPEMTKAKACEEMIQYEKPGSEVISNMAGL
jgi:hypothetical protein